MERKIYFGGNILPLTGEGERLDAVAVGDGIIMDTGKKEDLLSRWPGAEEIDLEGRTLIPSFIDPHSHITSLAETEGLCSLEGVKSTDEILARLSSYAERMEKKPGDFVMGFGYDNNDFPGHKHPTRDDLDKLAPFRAGVSHKSGHMGVMSSGALEFLGITDDMPDPEGGHIGHDENGRCNGYLEETAFTTLTAKMPRPKMEDRLKALELAENIYFSYGITTCQDGITKTAELSLLEEAEKRNLLKMDVVSYMDMRDHSMLFSKEKTHYVNHFREGGMKIFLDGSPQGRTAWMLEPYKGGDPGYRGYPIYTDEEVEAFIEKCMDDEVQILAHSNGDAAAEQYIRCFERVAGSYPPEERERKLRKVAPVLIHAQLLRPGQMPRMKKLNMTASFFVSHIKHWGDVHIENFGFERANIISPVKSALENGLLVTFHEDTPVIKPDMVDPGKDFLTANALLTVFRGDE